MTTPPIRVLVVDDSAFARKVMREVLSHDPRIEVIGTARDGLDALEKIAEKSPDVVTLDLVMPELDGVGVLNALAERPTSPRVVIVTMSEAESPLAVAALQAGAFDVVHKPTALATDRLYELGAELVEKVVLAASAPATLKTQISPKLPPATMPELRASRTKIVVVGASTGGPHAITLLLRALPATMPVPVVVVVHMPVGYTEAFAERLNRDSAIEVVEAAEGMKVTPGRVIIARAGVHLRFRASANGPIVAFDVEPLTAPHRPAVDVLFSSAASSFGDGVLAVVLTGMGADGLAGAREVRELNGRVIVEDASSCVVYGMPRAVAQAGLSEASIPLSGMPAAILERL